MDELIKRTLIFCEELAGFELFPYQRAFGYRIIESIILGDAEEITGLLARQSGKSETIATILAGVHGAVPQAGDDVPAAGEVQARRVVGIFAPVDEQADIVFGRIVTRLTSEHRREDAARPGDR